MMIPFTPLEIEALYQSLKDWQGFLDPDEKAALIDKLVRWHTLQIRRAAVNERPV